MSKYALHTLRRITYLVLRFAALKLALGASYLDNAHLRSRTAICYVIYNIAYFLTTLLYAYYWAWFVQQQQQQQQQRRRRRRRQQQFANQ